MLIVGERDCAERARRWRFLGCVSKIGISKVFTFQLRLAAIVEVEVERSLLERLCGEELMLFVDRRHRTVSVEA